MLEYACTRNGLSSWPQPRDLTQRYHRGSRPQRVAYELGCHAVKVPWTRNAESFRKVCEAVPIPVLISGGPKGGDFAETLEVVRYAIAAGGAGVHGQAGLWSGRSSHMHPSIT